MATVIALVGLGWAFARDIGKAAAPTFFRRMDPAPLGPWASSCASRPWP